MTVVFVSLYLCDYELPQGCIVNFFFQQFKKHISPIIEIEEKHTRLRTSLIKTGLASLWCDYRMY